jgi:dTDP-4-dehydrorhamnose reductase
MRIYITGADGSLGKALIGELAAHPRRAEWQVKGVSIRDFDIDDRSTVMASIREFAPDLVLHLAAITVVASCEKDTALAIRVNVGGVHHVVEACRQVGSKIVYISSDYIFDGVAAPASGYPETAVPNPLNVYAVTKLAGEQVAGHVPEHLIIRTSWLFGGDAENNDDVLATIRSAERGERLSLISDQISRPTYTLDLARAIVHLITLDDFPTGVVNAANAGPATRYSLGVYALERYDSELSKHYAPIPVQFDTVHFVGARPRSSVLNTDRLAALGFQMPQWKDAVDRHCANLQQGGPL